MPAPNVQALIALALFLVSLFIARVVNNVTSGRWPGGKAWVVYLRALLGFLLAAAITFAFYAFAGIDILHR
ncbi:flagellar biosynthesis protein FliR [Aminithiophilus ramosus]|uniref:Flagellar biosynthesis protein FliR n=2 Tax=Synergistales TaxID=649776 RepID=A0A9Q7AB04_9BACT|nr:flagellar biosynthesis protein FliR [Aminithiophilus ramosus]NCC57742.1 flagellar biosynthesis protein FliR [Synergistales bacterium]QTX33600.1 flagellar biosynthesis protein FliR [Aminithiophilus ramosus]QVL37455.1 flagellar biosynthesis protein FliR [Synergistota bacterium]